MWKCLVLAAASFCSSVLAQGAPQINFVPSNITAGNSYTLSWSGGDSTPVSLTLMAGPSTNLLQTGIIAQNVSGFSYVWATDTTIFNGDKYAIMIAQGTQFSISSYFSISGGATPPTNTTESPSNTTTTTTTSSTEAATSTAHSRPNNSTGGPPRGGPLNDNRPGSKLLDKSGIAGIVVGCVAVMAALATLVIFHCVNKKMKAKKANSDGPDAETPLTAGMAPMTQRSNLSTVSHSRTPTPPTNYFPRKAVGSEDGNSLRNDASTTASPMQYRATDSPSTLVPVYAKRMGDDGSSMTSTLQAPSMASQPTSPDGPWEATPNVASFAYNPHRPVSAMHPGTLVPQYTGDTMVANSANQATSRHQVVSAVISPEPSPMQAQFGNMVVASDESARGVRERRVSNPPLLGQSKLRQEVE